MEDARPMQPHLASWRVVGHVVAHMRQRHCGERAWWGVVPVARTCMMRRQGQVSGSETPRFILLQCTLRVRVPLPSVPHPLVRTGQRPTKLNVDARFVDADRGEVLVVQHTCRPARA